MKAALAARAGDPEVLVLTEVPEPSAGPGEVLIAVRFAAVNFADVIRRRGTTHRPGAFPLVPGIEAMGTVTAVGAGVDLKVGQRVAAFPPLGGYAERVIVPAALAVPIPDEVSDEQAGSFLVVGLTAYHMLAGAARVRAGESILVTAAAGGVGTTAIQLAAALGLGPIIAAAGSRARAEAGVRVGATHAIDYSGGALEKEVRAATGGRGADLVLDAVGGPVRAAAFAALAPFGRLVHYGNASEAPESSPTESALRESVTGSFGFSIRGLSNRSPELVRAGAARLIDFMKAGKLRIAVEETFPLAEAAAAHRRLESRTVTGKLLLAMPGRSAS